MNVIVDLCLVPLGVGVSLSSYVAACEKVIEASGLSYKLHSYGTNIEGPWDEVMAVVKKCHTQVHEMGVPRITTTLKLGTRTDKEQSMQDKINSVTEKL
ncbi:MAG: MTH1187 family thiamine-binding protein [Planctomycetes bacterium]|nr:MTH1187 family thiamine-binding protein [Planctomycetota bacterium]